ncbi:MAG: ferric iron uptake transcriptional regulator [Pseudomonadales bacterium]|nr:ferric iron uptake transcriptional regulator [Pseudomonadales bacterium]
MSETRELKDHGLKATFPRRKILELMESSEVRHFSAEDIYRMLLNNDFEIGLATVYRVLTQFEVAGMVVKHHFEEGHSVFELSSDLHHDHIVCVRCGKVEEFHDDEIESRQCGIAARMGFELTDHDLNLYGLCPTCQTLAN